MVEHAERTAVAFYFRFWTPTSSSTDSLSRHRPKAHGAGTLSQPERNLASGSRRAPANRVQRLNDRDAGGTVAQRDSRRASTLHTALPEFNYKYAFV